MPRSILVLWLAVAGCGAEKTPGRLSAYDCILDETCSQRLVVAHRGFHRDCPENSLAAIRATASVGAELVELDVRHTADGMLVLMHDDTVDRTTDGAGELAAMTLAEVEELLLDGGDTEDPESCRVPTLSQAMALARTLGLLVYLDQKTDRTDLTLAAIRGGDHRADVLLRDDWERLSPMLAEEPGLLAMPPIENLAEAETIKAGFSGLRIVELALGGPSPELTADLHAADLKVQQDVMVLGDVPALVGDYTGWKSFVTAGVDVLQTEYPHLLVPAVREFEQGGVFPDEGPPAL